VIPTLYDALKAAYAEQGVPIGHGRTGGVVTIADGSSIVRFETRGGRLAVSVEGDISPDAFYALGIADARADGAIQAALRDAGRPRDAEQVDLS
jgi:hypothetical protein